MISLAKRVIRQMLGDKRNMAMILFGPILILTVLYFLLGNTSYKPTIAVQESSLPPALVTALKKQDAVIVTVTGTDTDVSQYLKENENTDAFLTASKSGFEITMYESSSKAAKALKEIQSAMASLNPSMKIETQFVVGKEDASAFESLGYVFFGLFSFFIIFLISGMSLVKERSNGTLERLLMTPVTRRSVILGYTVGYGVFAILQAVLMVLYGIYVLGVSCRGNVGWVILTMVLLAVSAVAFGTLVSVFAESELQVVQFIPIVFIPQVFFSGLIPLDTIPYGLGNLGYLTPVFYGCATLKKVMVEGGGFGDVWVILLELVGYIFILSVLNTLTLKKYRKL